MHYRGWVFNGWGFKTAKHFSSSNTRKPCLYSIVKIGLFVLEKLNNQLFGNTFRKKPPQQYFIVHTKFDTSRLQCIDSDLANVCHIWLDYRLVSFPSLPYAILKGRKVQ